MRSRDFIDDSTDGSENGSIWGIGGGFAFWVTQRWYKLGFTSMRRSPMRKYSTIKVLHRLWWFF